MVERKFEIVVNEYSSLEELQKSDRELIREAMDASTKAYAPYSGFNVGAAVMIGDGSILKGNNRENAAFPSGSCAEKTVINYTGANYPDEKIINIAICASIDGKFTEDPVSPCGSCRQLIAEEEERTGKKIGIILFGTKKIVVINGVSNLLPLQFHKTNLKG